MQRFEATTRYIWDVNEDGGVAWVLKGVGKPRNISLQLRDVTHMYVCENHETLSPWL